MKQLLKMKPEIEQKNQNLLCFVFWEKSWKQSPTHKIVFSIFFKYKRSQTFNIGRIGRIQQLLNFSYIKATAVINCRKLKYVQEGKYLHIKKIIK